MNEEQIHPYDTYDYINVYQINDDVFVAETIEDAIELYKKSRFAEYERNTIRKVELLNYNAKIKRQIQWKTRHFTLLS